MVIFHSSVSLPEGKWDADPHWRYLRFVFQGGSPTRYYWAEQHQWFVGPSVGSDSATTSGCPPFWNQLRCLGLLRCGRTRMMLNHPQDRHVTRILRCKLTNITQPLRFTHQKPSIQVMSESAQTGTFQIQVLLVNCLNFPRTYSYLLLHLPISAS